MHISDGVRSLDQAAGVDDEISYHSSRALAELDRARSCADVHAARCHLRLAEQHLDRMRALCRDESAASSIHGQAS
ncbi:MAG: hypothetical protein QOG72_2938 [Sphingomonadales bacterium]|jgi:hypothetical protein|nr:hypothetical protein [Sphingomonadales bacterium]